MKHVTTGPPRPPSASPAGCAALPVCDAEPHRWTMQSSGELWRRREAAMLGQDPLQQDRLPIDERWLLHIGMYERPRLRRQWNLRHRRIARFLVLRAMHRTG